MTRRDRLGKGLGALLGEYMNTDDLSSGDILKLPVGSIFPNPMQPRRVFTDAELEDLTSSIRENGLLQPLVVRPDPKAPNRYQLVAGERRWRSITKLGWSEVPVVVRDASDETLLVLALVENLQREALNPMEEANGYQALAERFGMTQTDIAHAVGKDRSTVANLIRLLKLPPSIRGLVETGGLSMGHARALLTVDDPVRAGELARRAVKDGWSVREIERQAASSAGKKRAAKSKPRDPVTRALEEALQASLSTRVALRQGRGGKGAIEITFHGSEDFERIFELVTGKAVSELVE